ncbi:sensor histidine kinase [Gordonia liuliyuniae]|uniref:Sensor histidine kinase n=1 Tax=Gordonia liuliyuniae TaxID=2911517 RepID=A0ABS9ITB4_9ACTN|nr:sensor histidine kinase [Gordonia liuliyuniae]MCF8588810.1 sensor histidine kinase [Gordonia liuliyuniae]
MSPLLSRDRIVTFFDDDRMPWRQWRWVFGAVWMIFLVYPVVSVAQSDNTTFVKALGLVDLGVFATVYLVACMLLMDAVPSADADHDAVRWTVSGVLVVLACLLFPIIHEETFALAGFLMAVVSFIAPRRVQVAAIFALIAASYLVPRLLGWDVDFGVIAIMVAIGMTMIAIRAVSERERDREQSVERQRELNAELAVVAERESVARDVHDILGHSLTVISVKSELASRLIDLDPERAKAEIAEVNALSREALAEVRSTVGRLRTPELPSGLASAASALAAAGIVADLPDPADARTPHATLFAWVLREAVTNIVRHSGASSCRVRVGCDEITVADDGTGSAMLAFGNGLRGLSERVADAGGELRVESDEHGTLVTVTMVTATVRATTVRDRVGREHDGAAHDGMNR